MTYQRGMDLALWVDAHAGVDVIVRCASISGEFDESGEYMPEATDFDDLEEETGRLIGIVDGLLYLDHPVSPNMMPLTDVIAGIREVTARTGALPRMGIFVTERVCATPHSIDPALIAEIERDHQGIGRQQAEAWQLESEREQRFLHHLVDTQPCYLCGRMIRPGQEPYQILGPDAGQGGEGDPNYIPCDPTWKVLCSHHL